MLKAGPRERASTTFQARSRAVSPSAVSEEQVGVWGWASPLWRVSAPPAEMGFVRSEWTPTGSCAPASVRLLVSFSRGNPAAQVWALTSAPNSVSLPPCEARLFPDASFMD